MSGPAVSFAPAFPAVQRAGYDFIALDVTRTGLLASVLVSNGAVKVAHSVRLVDAPQREGFAEVVATTTGLPRAEVDTALLDLINAVVVALSARSTTAREKRGDSPAAESARPRAAFPGLVDLVADEAGSPAFLVVDRSAALGVSVVSVYSVLQGDATGETVMPPPGDALPWLLPRASMVQDQLRQPADAGQIFADVVAAVKDHVLLPTLVGHPDAYYELCAAWVFHTHFLEPAAYSPMLGFYAVPERGKSRTGRTLVYLARRGIHTETLREANLFRDAQDRGATLFIDCMNLWQKATKLGCEDILLQRFERGAKVSRVLYPDRGPFADTVYFDIFGPTILASNEPLGRILDTRCISISMPLAPDGVSYPVPSEAALLPIRERLVAWRARKLVERWTPALMDKPASSRLGDVLLPLAQIVAEVAPDRLRSFRALAKHLEGQRYRQRSLSWEASIVGAIDELAGQVSHGLLPLGAIVERLNADRPEKEHLTNRKTSEIVGSLGLETKKGHANKAALVWDEAKMAELVAHYAEVVSEKTAPDEASVPPEDAINANHANQNGSERGAAVSVVSVDSVGGGHEGADFAASPALDANPIDDIVDEAIE